MTRGFFTTLATALAIFTLLIVSCAPQVEPTPDQQDQEIITQLDELDAKRQAREKELAAMDVPQLAEELRSDSERGVEPFNSMPYAEMISRGEKAAPELFESLTDVDRTSILGMLALRQIDSGLYGKLGSDFRVSVLIDTLVTSRTFNIWGMPHLYWEDAATATIDEGREALEPLMALLLDRREAPMWGSEEVMEFQQYSYRVQDYAWGLSMAILGEEIEIPMAPEARDKLIDEMLDR